MSVTISSPNLRTTTSIEVGGFFRDFDNTQRGREGAQYIEERVAFGCVVLAPDAARYTEKRIQKLTLDPTNIRNRMKIEGAVRNARAFLAIQEEFGSPNAYCWRFVNGRPKLNRWKAMREIPAIPLESDAFSEDLRRRGFSFVGSPIIYAHMQAVGMVNDHLVDCFGYREIRQLDCGGTGTDC